MKDLKGSTIRVGDKIAYATRGSALAYLNTGTVVALTARDKISVKVDGRGDVPVTVGHGYRYLPGEACATVLVYARSARKKVTAKVAKKR